MSLKMSAASPFYISLIATAVVAALGGYYVGSKYPAAGSRSIIVEPDPEPIDPTSHFFQKPRAKEGDGDYTSEESDDEDDLQPSDLQNFSSITGECKLVLVVRSDLGMTKGKMAAQCGHATLYCYKAARNFVPSILQRWERTGQAKIALKIDSEDDLMMLQATAMSMGVIAKVVRDAGRTQIAAGSATVLGVGPGEQSVFHLACKKVIYIKNNYVALILAPKSVVDQITGHLKLL